MMTIKIDNETRSKVFELCEYLDTIEYHPDRFLFDRFRIETIIDDNNTCVMDVRQDLNDALIKVRVNQIMFYEEKGKTIKTEAKSTATMDKEGNVKLGNMNDLCKKIVRARIKKGEMPEGMTANELTAAIYLNEVDSIQRYIMYKLENREVIYKESVKEHKPRLTEKAIKQSQKNEGKDIVLNLDQAIVYIKRKGLHKIHCECWGVRGHYRHYKSGKVVFIESYQKGSKRNEIKAKDKTYILKGT